MPRKAKYKVSIGDKFGWWTILEEPVIINKARQVKSVCECGRIKNVSVKSLVEGISKRCAGCQKRNASFGHNHPRWTGSGSIPGRLIARIKQNAKIRNLEYNISNDYLWQTFLEQNGICPISGMKLHFETKEINSGFIASLDRIDNNIGYVKGNIRWIYTPVNVMKNCYDDEYFILLCNSIASKNPVFVNNDILRTQHESKFNYGKSICRQESRVYSTDIK